MSQRQYIIEHPSEKVQGAGSWIKVRTANYGYVKQLRKQLRTLDPDAEGLSDDQREQVDDDRIALNDQFLIDHVYAWNWVDDDGNPLALPKEDPTVINLLTTAEIEFIGQCIGGDNGTDPKKSSGK